MGAATLAASLLGGLGLRRLKTTAAAFLRPPGAGDETDFLAACIRCGQCAQACPTQILWLADAEAGLALGTPYLVARDKPCNLCQGEPRMQCIAACPTNALENVSRRSDVKMGLAVIDRDSCLPWQNPPVACKACWHACPFPNDAITFDPRGRVVVVDNTCVGCGLCEHVCLTPEPAIRVVPRAQIDRDQTDENVETAADD
jgi:MauM/NapG family ferredoxin protein